LFWSSIGENQKSIFNLSFVPLPSKEGKTEEVGEKQINQ
jgi:hypothetical protein